jgi:predicted Zn-dependent peptidase
VAVERVHDVMLEEVERIVGEGITETELRRAKAQFERHWLHELARIDSRADAFGEFATLYGDPELVNARLDQIDAIDTGAVAVELQSSLAPAHRSTLIYRKETSS